jgi:hypothetical protein
LNSSFMLLLYIFFFPLAPLLGSSLPYLSTGLITQFLDLSQAAGLLGRVIISSQGLNLNTEKCGHTLNNHAQGGIRTHSHGLKRSKTVHASDRSATTTGCYYTPLQITQHVILQFCGISVRRRGRIPPP